MSVLRVLVCGLLACFAALAGTPDKVIAFYSANTEPDHVDFAKQAISFYTKVANQHGIEFETATHWEEWDAARLKPYRLVLWLNDFPHTQAERTAFETYMNAGGAWLGFHVSAYNDKDTKWPWFVSFLGGGVFDSNNWPPLSAKLTVDDPKCTLTQDLGTGYEAPANEWYIWKPSPRMNPNVKVLLTLDPANYPLGFKDTLLAGDLPVVWTNRKYKMIYLNMGHGDKIFTNGTQNRLMENAFLWFLGEGNRTF
jgi:uncharacterized protein